MIELHIRHQFRDLGEYYVTNLFQSLHKHLKNKYPHIKFIISNQENYEDYGYGSIYSCMNFSIVNPKTSKYIAVSLFDNWKYHFMKHLGWEPEKMVQFFYAGGFNFFDYFYFKKLEINNPDVYLPVNITEIYKSFYYNPFSDRHDELKTELYQTHNSKETKDILYFRGYMWDFRKDLVRGIGKDSSVLIIDKNKNTQDLLDYDKYLRDISMYRCALSLPGGTEICNRDIECFGIGVPVIRPHLDINYPDPLLPNYHYISCYHDCKYLHGSPEYVNPKEFQKYLIYYWEKVKDNFEYLDFISHNARQWYIKNCTLDQNIKYLLGNIDLELLYD
jgi:hypothetical protein